MMLKKFYNLIEALKVKCFVACMVFLFLACSKPNANESITDSTVVATVNGSEVTTEELRNEMEVLLKQFRVKDEDDMTVEEKIILKTDGLNRIIKNKILRKEAILDNVYLSKDEYNEAFSEVKNGYLEDSFAKYLEVEGIEFKEWDKKFRNNLLIKKLITERVNSKVFLSDEQVKKYYDAHQEEFQMSEQVRSLHIMVGSEDEARSIQKQLKSGKNDFSVFAQKYSLGPEGPQGGDLGYFEVGQMPEEFDSVFKLKINSISEPIQTPYGYHLFKVVDKKPARQMSFEESRKTIHAQLLRKEESKAFDDWLVKLKDKSEIDIKHDVLDQIN